MPDRSDLVQQSLPPPLAGVRRPLTARAGAFALFLALIWGAQPVAIKAGLADAGPLRLSAMRMTLSGLVIIAYALVTRTSLRPPRREWRALGGLGVLFVVQTTLMYVGGDQTTAGHASVLIFTFPLWTAVFGHFVVPGDHMSRVRTGGLLVAYAGVVVVFAGGLADHGASWGGDLMTLTSAMLLGGRQVYLSHFSQGIAPARLLMTQSISSVLVFGIAGWLLESGPLVWSGEFLAALLYQGVVIGGFGFIGNVWLLKRYLPSRVAATMLTAPIFGVILSWVILGEAVGPELALGVALLVAGSSIVQWPRASAT